MVGAPSPDGAGPTGGEGAWGGPRTGRFFALIWLIYLVYPVIGLFDAHMGTARRLLGLLGLALFVVTYLWAWSGHEGWSSRRVPPALATILALSVGLTALLGGNGVGLFIFAAPLAARLSPLRLAVAAVVARTVACVVEMLALHMSAGTILALGITCAATGVAGLIGWRLAATHTDLRAAREEIARLAVVEGMVRGALVALLSLEPDLEVAQVARGDAVVPAALAAAPDIALLDIELPGGDGLRVAADLRLRLPACRVIMLTTFGRPGYLRRALEAGAAGFLLKDAPSAELAVAIRQVHGGRRVVAPDLALAALSLGESPLSAREQEVLAASRLGQSIAALAGLLHLSEGTVRNHLSSAIQKLGARGRAEAVKVAEDNGWL